MDSASAKRHHKGFLLPNFLFPSFFPLRLRTETRVRPHIRAPCFDPFDLPTRPTKPHRARSLGLSRDPEPRAEPLATGCGHQRLWLVSPSPPSPRVNHRRPCRCHYNQANVIVLLSPRGSHGRCCRRLCLVPRFQVQPISIYKQYIYIYSTKNTTGTYKFTSCMF